MTGTDIHCFVLSVPHRIDLGPIKSTMRAFAIQNQIVDNGTKCAQETPLELHFKGYINPEHISPVSQLRL